MKIRARHVTVAAMIACSVRAALAHDLWVATQGTTHTLRYGHEHAHHHDGPAPRYAPDFVKRAACFGRDGKKAQAILTNGFPARLSGSCAASIFSASSGYWSKTPHGTKNQPKTEVVSALDSWESFDTVKTLRQWSPAFAQPLSQALEVVPAQNPLQLKAGDTLSVRVIWQGQPRAGVSVTYHGSAQGKTGVDGALAVRLQRPGLQLIQASIVEPPVDPLKADKAVHAANLSFVLR